MHRGLDEDEPLPSGLLEARLKTTPASSLALQPTFTHRFYFPLPRFLLFWPLIPLNPPVLTSCLFLKLSFLSSLTLGSRILPPPPPPPPPPLKDLSLLIILTIPLHTRLVSSIFNLGFSRAISYTQHAEANWFKEARFACWLVLMGLTKKLISADGEEKRMDGGEIKWSFRHLYELLLHALMSKSVCFDLATLHRNNGSELFWRSSV